MTALSVRTLTVQSGSTTTVSDTLKIGATDGIIVNDNGSGFAALTASIGVPEDGNYTDGLFKDFTSQTRLGVAIDRFNEILKLLVPAPASDISDIAPESTGSFVRLSFGSSNTILHYTNSSTAAGFSAVDVNGQYSHLLSNGNNIRRGAFAAATDIVGDVNELISEDRHDNGVLNFPSHSFGNAEVGNLNLEVNGVNVHTVDLANVGTGAGAPASGSQNNVNGNGSGFLTLSAFSTGTFANSTPFENFKHRTTRFKIAAADQTTGWNYARITQVDSAVTRSTNYVEWVNDPDANALASAGNTLTVNTFTPGTTLSGVKYFASGTADYKVRVSNAYRNVFTTKSITFSPVSNVTVPDQAFPEIGDGENHLKVLHLTGVATVSAEKLLNQSISAAVNVDHPLKANLTGAGSATLSGILLYRLSDTSTAQLETFRKETYRLQSGTFADQAAVGSSAWNSALHMSGTSAGHDDGLIFFNEKLLAPRNTIVSGDFRNSAEGGSIAVAPNSNPNYSNITTGKRTFFRNLTNNLGQTADSISLVVQGTSNIQNGSGALNANNCRIYVKFPVGSGGKGTGWLDVSTLFASGTYTDNSGASFGTLDNTLNSTFTCTFGDRRVAANENIVVKVEADAGWTGEITRIQVTFTNSNAADAPDLTSITQDNDGVAAKLSFGAAKSIAGFTNVSNTAGVAATVDVNGEYLVDTPANRHGVISSVNLGVTGTVAGSVVANLPNYPVSSFGEGDVGNLSLEVNGATLHTVNLSSFTGAGAPGSGTASSLTNGSGFINISTSQPATGSNNIPDFLKMIRTAKLVVSASDMRNGWNYARVVHAPPSGNRTTNYIEWVVDSNSTPLTIDPVLENFQDETTFHQSGVKYFVNPRTFFKASVTGSYSNVYSNSNSAISFGNITNANMSAVTGSGDGVSTRVVAASSMLKPELNAAVANAEQKILNVTGTLDFSRAKSLPEDGHSSGCRLSVVHPLKGTTTTATLTKSNFLVLSSSNTSNINTLENFSMETYRIISGSYANQASLTDASNRWNPQLSLDGGDAGHNTGLLVYDGAIHSPENKGNSGDFRSVADGGIYQGPGSNVNYSSLTNSTRSYIRYFKNNTTDDKPSVVITLTGNAQAVARQSDVGSDVVGTLGANSNVFLSVNIPGKSGWLDAM